MKKDLLKRVSEGLTAKLNFDYACDRGNYFGEYYSHGVCNEMLCANIDSINFKLHSGFPHESLNVNRGRGRKSELDFCIIESSKKSYALCCEIKWAGSSHCNDETIIVDLIRLQIIANEFPNCECGFILSGTKENIDTIFNSKLFSKGTNCPLTRYKTPHNGDDIAKKNFSLSDNPDHASIIKKFLSQTKPKNANLASRIRTITSSPIFNEKSAPPNGRFQSFAWRILPN